MMLVIADSRPTPRLVLLLLLRCDAVLPLLLLPATLRGHVRTKRTKGFLLLPLLPIFTASALR